MRYLIFFVLMLFILFQNGYVTATTTGNPKLVVVTENYYPFSYSDNGKVSGSLVDIIESISYTAGMPVSRNEILIIPWNQAFAMAQQMPDILLLGIYRMPDRENLFKWIGPVETDPSVFFVKPGSQVPIKTFTDIKKLKIGVIAGDAHYELLRLYGIAQEQIITSSDGSDLIRWVLNGEIDTFYYGEKAGKALANKVTGSSDALKTALKFGESDIWFAMSKTTSDSTINALQVALDKKLNRTQISGH